MKKLIYILLLSIFFIICGCNPINETYLADNTQISNQGSQTITNEFDPGTEHVRTIDGLTMVYVPEGQFLKGSNDTETGFT